MGDEPEGDPCGVQPMKLRPPQSFSGRGQQTAVVVEQSMAANEPVVERILEFVGLPVEARGCCGLRDLAFQHPTCVRLGKAVSAHSSAALLNRVVFLRESLRARPSKLSFH